MNKDKIREALERAMARIGCPPGDNADADLYREMQAAIDNLDKQPIAEPVGDFPPIPSMQEVMDNTDPAMPSAEPPPQASNQPKTNEPNHTP